MEDSFGDAPSKYFQRCIGLEFVDDLVGIVGQSPYCTTKYFAKLFICWDNIEEEEGEEKEEEEEEEEEEEDGKLALFMKRIINFQQMIRCKKVLLRKDWRIINLLLVAGLQEDGQARDERVSIKKISTSKEFKRRSSVGS